MEQAAQIMRETDIPRTSDSFHPSYGVMVVHCVCHRFALVLTDAISQERVPQACVKLLQDLYSFFSKSPKRKRALREFIAAENVRRASQQKRAISNPDDELETVMETLRERYKLPRHIVLTRWLSSERAIHVLVVCRPAYCVFF